MWVRLLPSLPFMHLYPRGLRSWTATPVSQVRILSSAPFYLRCNMKICSSCGKEKPENEFHWKNKEHTILNSKCKICSNARTTELRRERYRKVQLYKEEHGCAVCGEKRYWVLDFHHRDGATKENEISYMLRKNMSWDKILQELNKCDVLCANCHRDYHYKISKKT